MSQTPSGNPSTRFGLSAASAPTPPINNISSGFGPPSANTPQFFDTSKPLFAGVSNAPVAAHDKSPTKTPIPVTRAVSTADQRPSSKSYKETVILVVGAAKEHYTLHKELLCFYSDFFRAAFNGSFKEATERKIELPETEAEVFEAFQAWLYTQKLPKNEIKPAKMYPEWPLLTKLWIFGDKYQFPLLQNNVADAMLDKVDKDAESPVYVLNLAYENTTPNAPLRKIVVDIMAYRGDMSVGGHCLDSKYWSLQACLDAMEVMDSARAQKVPRYTMPTREKCHYHVHAAGEKC
ncbi:hypothetical protein E4T49_05135 [Aureobasidium sp. EXF-10728]|nr:hypothetical protein E4T49_05135 [Aureobasidium sp. EXF-10728]